MGRAARRKRSNRRGKPSAGRRAQDTETVVYRTASPWGKMSEKLKFVAEPWTSRLGPEPPQSTMAFVYETSSLIWNASRLREPAERTDLLDDVQRLMAPVLPHLPASALLELIQEIYQRACQRYPDDPRLIAHIEVENRGGGSYHVMVASIDPS